jgi:acetyl-CoA synthetase
VVRDGDEQGEALASTIGETVVAHLGKSFKPGAVHLVPSLPKTRNGKILRRLARAAYLGLEPGDSSSLEDPTTLEPIRGLRRS